MKRVALIGYGAIAAGVVQTLPRHADGRLAIVGVLARPDGAATARARLGDVPVFARLEDLLGANPDIVVECAGHAALAAHGEAVLAAGIDLSQQDDEFRRIVGAFASSEEYNLLVVTRDAANLYLSDPNHQDLASYRAYIEQHSLKGDMSWQWSDEGSFDRYGSQRKSAQKAGLRSNTALALAVANRLVSSLHAARAAGRMHAGAPQGWRLDLDPDPTSPGAFRAALSTNF